MNIEAITVEISKLTLKPGDTLVLRVPGEISSEMKERMLRTLTEIVPEGCFSIVMPETCEFQVIEGTKA